MATPFATGAAYRPGWLAAALLVAGCGSVAMHAGFLGAGPSLALSSVVFATICALGALLVRRGDEFTVSLGAGLTYLVAVLVLAVTAGVTAASGHPVVVGAAALLSGLGTAWAPILAGAGVSAVIAVLRMRRRRRPVGYGR